MLPNFLIIGAQKSASTFVHECIREHPDVFMPRHEIAFFQDPDYLESDISQFKSIFDAVKNEKAIGIKCPDYLARPECPERIYKHIPNAKLIVVLRNPVDRAISAYYWFMQVGIIPVRPLEEGLKDVISGQYDSQYPRCQEIINYGFYHEHLMRYLHYFDKKQLLIVLQSDLKDSPQQVISRIYRFLEIDESYLPKTLIEQPKQSVYSLPRLKWLSAANRLFFYTYSIDKDNMMALHPIDNKLSRLCYYIFVAIDRYLLAFIFGNTKAKLNGYIRNILGDKYKKDIEALEKFLGQELIKWKQGV
jgi:hypothetical protein